jgi:lambda repressor-like predicted transcriptional regulator
MSENKMMWGKFTEESRRIIFFAQEEAGRLGENYVSTEHILLGMIRENGSAAIRLLEALGVSQSTLKAQLERQVTKGEGYLGKDMELTPRAKQVIDLAYEEARMLVSNDIGSEHLLLGLIREAEGLAGRVLTSLGVELVAARSELKKMSGETSETSPKEPVLFKGCLGELVPGENQDVVEVAQDEEAMAALIMVFEARDSAGYANLVRASEVFLVPPKTEAKLLRDESIIPAFLVRLRSGEHAGKTGWVFPRSFLPTGEDTTPFPPRI